MIYILWKMAADSNEMLVNDKGQYLICGDTIVEDIPTQTHRVRPWGPGNNPKTALRQFLNEYDRFMILA